MREIPTPDSVVWQAFYHNFRSTTEVQDFFVDRFGLTSSAAATVVTAGQQYLQQFSAIDDARNAEVRARFRPAYLPANLAEIAKSAGLTPPPPSAPIGGRMADGRTVQDAIKADGLPARYERQHDAALRAHQAQLRQTISPRQFMALQGWINSNVAPSIKSFDVTQPVPAMLTSRPILPPIPSTK